MIPLKAPLLIGLLYCSTIFAAVVEVLVCVNQ